MPTNKIDFPAARDDFAYASTTLLNQFAREAAVQRRALEDQPPAVRREATVLRVFCDRGCTRRIAAVYKTPLGRLAAPYGRTLLYRLPADDARAPQLPDRLAGQPDIAPQLVTMVIGYMRQYLTGGEMPDQLQYSQFLANIAARLRERPLQCRCECPGKSLHHLAVPAVLSAARIRSEVGASAVVSNHHPW